MYMQVCRIKAMIIHTHDGQILLIKNQKENRVRQVFLSLPLKIREEIAETFNTMSYLEKLRNFKTDVIKTKH